jgi:hypothetical protein
MRATKLRVGTAVLTALAVIDLTLAGLMYQTPAQLPGPEAGQRDEPTVAAPKDNDEKEGRLLAREPKELAVLRGHTNGIWAVALTPDGRTLRLRQF